MSSANSPRCRLTNPLQRRNISAALANVHLRPAVISPATAGSTPENGTISVPSPVARPDAPARTISSNSLFPFPPYCYSANRLFFSYRIHLSPGSHRNSVRTTTPRKRSTSSKAPSNPESVTRQHPVEQRRIYAHLPDSTPPLTQATLSSAPTRLHPISARISPTPSPSTSYSLNTHRIPSAVSSLEVDLPVSSPLNYNYRMIYDQPYGTFVNNPSQDGSHNTVHSHSHYGGPPSRSTSPCAAMPSRHSLSHINNPHYSSSHGPPSPTSVSSHTSAHSGPPTPTYPVSYPGTHPYSHSHSTIVASQPAVHNNQVQSQSYLFQNAYTPNGVIQPHSTRYSPPLTLAPIQDGRYVRRLETPCHSQSHTSPYLHHSRIFPVSLFIWSRTRCMEGGGYEERGRHYCHLRSLISVQLSRKHRVMHPYLCINLVRCMLIIVSVCETNDV
jgi:hypothetical protein